MNKLGKKYHTFGTDWIYVIYVLVVIIVISIGVRIALSIGLKMSSTVANPLTLLLFFGMLAFMNYYVRTRRPRFTLYDNAIKVIENGEEKTFEWSEISRMDGTRQTTIYFVLVLKSGANHFYNESIKLFSVSFLTRRANQLVTFILSKTSEAQVPKYTEKISDGETVQLGSEPHGLGKVLSRNYKPIIISNEVIGNGKEWFKWDEIEQFTFSKTDGDPTVKVRISKSNKYQTLSTVPSNLQYLLMGIIDNLLDTAYLSEAQDYLMDYRQQFSDFSKVFVKVAIIFTLLFAFLLGIPIIYRISQGLPIFTP